MVDMSKWEGEQQVKPEEEGEYLKDLCAYLRQQQTLSEPTKNAEGMMTCEVVPDEVAAHAADVIEELWGRLEEYYNEGVLKGMQIKEDELVYEATKGRRMNREDIIRMAREAGYTTYDSQDERLERFAALVAAAEREAYQHVHRLLEVHQAALEASEKPGPWPAKEVIAKAVAAEREACARICDEVDRRWINQAEKCAERIRARGERD